MRILIRCDASQLIGSGHVMRCRNLARAVRLRGAKVLFLCRETPGDLIDLLTEEFAVRPLPPLTSPEPTLTKRKGRDLYSAWLGCSQSQDVADCITSLSGEAEGPIDWIVVDHYGLDRGWELGICEALSRVQGWRPRVLVLDDLADRRHEASLLVDANRLEPTASDCYRSLVPEECQLLLGPTFAALDPIYPLLHPLAPQRRALRRVLVFFGAVDRENHTAVAMKALSHPDLINLAVDVVLDPTAPHHATVAELVRLRPDTELHGRLPNLAALMLRADLAIGAAGTTSWERGALALPMVVSPVADNQQQGARALSRAGAAVLVDLKQAVDPCQRLIEEIRRLLLEPERLVQLSDRARALGDGRGLGRLTTALMGPGPGRRLRTATLADEGLYHAWANDREVRRQSFHHAPIPLADHQRWFRDRLQSTDALLRVMVDGDGLPLGQIRFERSRAEPDRAMIGFSLDPQARGHGLAAELLQLGVAELTRQWGETVQACGQVRATNVASAKAFLRAGFTEDATGLPGVRCFIRPAIMAD